MSPEASAEGWYKDPYGEHEARWFSNGTPLPSFEMVPSNRGTSHLTGQLMAHLSGWSPPKPGRAVTYAELMTPRPNNSPITRTRHQKPWIKAATRTAT